MGKEMLGELCCVNASEPVLTAQKEETTMRFVEIACLASCRRWS